MKVMWRGTLYEASEEFEVKGLKSKIKTSIPPNKRTFKNLPRYSTGKPKVRFQEWLEMEHLKHSTGKGSDGKWYGLSHRAVFGFKIGDKIKEGDIAYDGKEYTIETEEQAKEAAIRFAKGVD